MPLSELKATRANSPTRFGAQEIESGTKLGKSIIMLKVEGPKSTMVFSQFSGCNTFWFSWSHPMKGQITEFLGSTTWSGDETTDAIQHRNNCE